MSYRIVQLIIVIAVLVWIFSSPAHAGDTIHGWITGVATFFSHVTRS